MCLFRKKKFYEIAFVSCMGCNHTVMVYAHSQAAAVRKILKDYNVAQVLSVKEVTF